MAADPPRDTHEAPTTALEAFRCLGLDMGNRRIGVAVTGPLGLSAQPVLTLHRSTPRQDLRSILRLARRHEVSAIVIGNPLHMSGDLSPQAHKAHAFAHDLHAELPLMPIYLWDERLTTTEAHRHLHSAGRPGPEHRAVVDQVAAVLILGAFLDAIRSRPEILASPFLS